VQVVKLCVIIHFILFFIFFTFFHFGVDNHGIMVYIKGMNSLNLSAVNPNKEIETMTHSIIVTPNYYGGTCNAPQESYLTWRDLHDNPNHPDATEDIAEWDTEEEAQAIIDGLQDDGPYYLSHGEAGAPTYTIVEDFNDGGDDCFAASNEELSGYTEIDEDDLPDGIQSKLDGLNVEYHSNDSKYDTYTANYVDPETEIEYVIAFCPRTVALQINIDDLGGIDWDHAAYFVEDAD